MRTIFAIRAQVWPSFTKVRWRNFLRLREDFAQARLLLWARAGGYPAAAEALAEMASRKCGAQGHSDDAGHGHSVFSIYIRQRRHSESRSSSAQRYAGNFPKFCAGNFRHQRQRPHLFCLQIIFCLWTRQRNVFSTFCRGRRRCSIPSAPSLNAPPHY